MINGKRAEICCFCFLFYWGFKKDAVCKWFETKYLHNFVFCDILSFRISIFV